MRKISFVLLLAFFIPSLFAQQKKTTVAVLEFQSGGTLEKTEVYTLTNRFRALLGRTQAFQLVEREKMNEILKTQDFNMSDACNTQECAVQVGQLLGVEAMVAGDIGKLGETYTIDIRLIDVKTSAVIQSMSKDHQGKIEKLLDVMQNMANALADAVEGRTSGKRYNLNITATIPRSFPAQKVDILVDGNKVGQGSAELSLPEGIHKILVTTNNPDLTQFNKDIDLVSDQKLDIKLDFSEAYNKRVAAEAAAAQAALALAAKQKLEKEKAERLKDQTEKELAEKQKAIKEKLERDRLEREKTTTASKPTNKKLWYIIGGVAVVGGASAILLSGGGSKSSKGIPDMILPPE